MLLCPPLRPLSDGDAVGEEGDVTAAVSSGATGRGASDMAALRPMGDVGGDDIEISPSAIGVPSVEPRRRALCREAM